MQHSLRGNRRDGVAELRDQQRLHRVKKIEQGSQTSLISLVP